MKKILFMFFGLFLLSQAYSQNLSLTPNSTFAVCPNEWITYNLTNSSTAACNYNWTVTNGEILGGLNGGGNVWTFTGGNIIQIKWYNTTADGTIQVSASCDPNTGNGSLNATVPILSINGVNPGVISGAATVNVNITSNQVYQVPQINFPNVGPGDVNPKQVNGYEWEIPSGWSVISGGNTKSITVQPDNCSGGNLRVRGKNTLCTGNTFYTNWSTVKTVTRTIGNPGAISGDNFVLCTNTSVKTYSISAVAGATSYSWTLPSGWSGASTSNSITVTPNGLNGGNITVKANGCSLQSQQASKSISLFIEDPNNPFSISGSNTVCISGANYTLQNIPSGTVTWSVSPCNLFSTCSGTGSTASISAANALSQGLATITFNIQTVCGNAQESKSIWVGKPHITYVDFTNETEYGDYFCSGNRGNIFTITSSTPTATYQARLLNWSNNNVIYTSPTVYSGNGPHYWTYYSVPNPYVMEVRGTNACGTYDWQPFYVECVDCSGAFTFSVYPNPTSEELTVTTGSKSNSTPTDVVLVNSDGAIIYNERIHGKDEIKIPVRGQKKGIYYLKVFQNGKSEQRQIIID